MSARGILATLTMLAVLLPYAGASDAGEEFSPRSLRGTYSFSGAGSIGGVPATVVGLNGFDGVIGCDITATLNLGGQVVPIVSVLCSYVVNADGTGATTVTFTTPDGLLGPFVSNFAIVDRKEVNFILADQFGGGTIGSGVSKRQAGQD